MVITKRTSKQSILSTAFRHGWVAPEPPIPYGRESRGTLYNLQRDETAISIVFDRHGGLRSASRTQSKGRPNPLMTLTPGRDKLPVVLGWLSEDEAGA